MIEVSETHALPKKVALERVKRFLGELRERADSSKIKDVSERWIGDRAEFAFKAESKLMTFDITGSLLVTDKAVDVSVSLPLMAMPVKGTVEEMICTRLAALLAAPYSPPVSGGGERSSHQEGGRMTDPSVPPETAPTSGSGEVAAAGDASAKPEFYTFDEVLKVRSISESTLKKLVSEGAIRAFRPEGDVPKFRRSDVENLKIPEAPSEEETGVIDLSKGKGGSSEPLTDDLIFDEGDDLDLSAGAVAETPPVVPIGWIPLCTVMEQTGLTEARIDELVGICHLKMEVKDGVKCYRPEDIPNFKQFDSMYTTRQPTPPVMDPAPVRAPEPEKKAPAETATAVAAPPAPPPPPVKNGAVKDTHSRTACEHLVERKPDGTVVTRSTGVCDCKPVLQVLVMPEKDDRLVVPMPSEPKPVVVAPPKRGLPWWVWLPLILAGVYLATMWAWTVNLNLDRANTKETAKAAPVATVDTTAIDAVRNDLAATKHRQAEKNSSLDAADQVLLTNVGTLRKEVEGLKTNTANPSESSAPAADPVPAPSISQPLSGEEQAALVKLTRLMKFVTGWAKQAKKDEPSLLVDEGIASISGFREYPVLKKLGAKRILEEMPPGQVSLDLVKLALEKNGIK